MDNNIDINNLLEKAQEMINNNQIPEEFKTVVNQVSSDNISKDTNSDVTNTYSEKSNSSGESPQSLDISKLVRLANSINSTTQNDDVSNLLNALKPYLRDYKKEKVDEYIKLIKLGKAAQLFDVLGGDSK